MSESEVTFDEQLSPELFSDVESSMTTYAVTLDCEDSFIHSNIYFITHYILPLW